MEQTPEKDTTTAPTEGTTVVAVNVVGDQVGAGWGKARTVALATIARGTIVDWDEVEVGWDVAHDAASSEGSHHANIVRFLRDHQVKAVVTGHMGPPMAQTMRKLHVFPLVNATGDARDAALAGAAFVEEYEGGAGSPSTQS